MNRIYGFLSRAPWNPKDSRPRYPGRVDLVLEIPREFLRALTLFVFVSLLAVLCVGCSKKQEPGTTSSDGKSAGQASPQKQIEQTSSLQGDVNKTPASEKPADANISAKVTRPSEERKNIILPNQPKDTSPIAEKKEMNLEQFSALKTSDEKVEWISEFADARPEAITAMAEKALGDSDVEVRSAAMEAIIDNEVPNAVGPVSKALKDKEEQVRQQAVEACEYIDDKQAAPILTVAINDESEDVRSAVFMVADQKDADTKAGLYKAGITSSYEDVKEATITGLVDMSTPKAVDILLEGLKDSNPDVRENVSSSLSFLIGQEFEKYNDAKKWWDKNRNRFDEELVEKDDEKAE